MAPLGYPSAQFLQTPSTSSVPPGAMPPQITSQQSMSSTPFPLEAPSTNILSGGEISDDVSQRLEKKEHMVAQLGSFLAQMKQESEGSAAAWKEKLQETAELKGQLTNLAQELADSQAKEIETSSQLSQTLQDLEIAMQEVETRDKRHIDELKAMHSEIENREIDTNHLKTGYEETVKQLSSELLDCRQQHQEEVIKLNDALQKLQECHELAVQHLDQERGDLHQALLEMNVRLEQMESSKQELGQHLWGISKELDQSKHREQELIQKVQEQVKTIEEARAAWTERFQQTQNDKAEQLSTHAMLKSQLVGMEAKWQEERSQKEELNAVIMKELQRFQSDMAEMQESHNSKMIEAEQENQRIAVELKNYVEQLELAKAQLTDTLTLQSKTAEQLAQLQAENGFLQQTESEKSNTLQDLNTELHSTLQQLDNARAQIEHFHSQWEMADQFIQRAVQLLGTDEKRATSSSSVARIPELLEWIEGLVNVKSGVEPLKLSLLRAQHERDSIQETLRVREQELTSELEHLRDELEATREDAKALAEEIAQLSQVSGGNEAKLSDQVVQLTKQVEEMQSTSGLQVIQLQRSLDGQRQRTQQLEHEKQELLHEAEQMNTSMESLFQTKSSMQAELDQLRTSCRELQLELSDLKETHEDLAESSQRTVNELNNVLQSVRSQMNELKANFEGQKKALDSLTSSHVVVQSEYEELLSRFESEKSQWTESDRETARLLEDKHRRLTEMMEMLTQLQTQKEFLEQARTTDAKDVRAEIERLQQQMQVMTHEKKRVDLALSTARAQLEQQQSAITKMQEDKRQSVELNAELEEQSTVHRAELQRVQGELERVGRARSTLQLEVRRLTDDAQDAARQAEVSRRDFRSLEKTIADEREHLHKELEEARAEASEGITQVEELQTKLASIQKAANATINELMMELQTAQDSISMDKARLSKDSDTAKAQLRSAQEELRRKDAEVQDLTIALHQERERNQEKETELTMKLSRQSSLLESKKQECDNLTHEVETKAARVNEYERKLAPLTAAKDNLQSKVAELKQLVEQKSRELHDLEERQRDELTRIVREKRELESAYLTLKEDMESVRSQTSGHQHQWQTEAKTLKAALERTKSELTKTNSDMLALAQRLETCQQAANETIADLTARVHAAHQEADAANASLAMERDHRREAEVQKMELQRSLRQLQRSAMGSSDGVHSLSPSVNNAMEEASALRSTSGWETNTLQKASTILGPESPAPNTNESFRKFYSNEQLTNAELSNLPVAMIKAQIGLDLASSSSSLGQSGGSRSVTKSNQSQAHRGTPIRDRNNDEIPPLPLESMTMYVCIAEMATMTPSRVTDRVFDSAAAIYPEAAPQTAWNQRQTRAIGSLLALPEAS